ncbi:hypothetical protein HYH03_010270 [Edaphochlamys debaryana]|uniref:Uncharacterized protein n=1 Tax=Edaphochlamys debaryana TaxID=47281 RepID=A0A836BW91_9CHLO|nr:hypothetical protein HYH03_010270 [Edaphochlamys debaryana]|eukprot:KAG2491486.1 hypothetical protein HYH03_010270 [Edaphochlamys debaryana]
MALQLHRRPSPAPPPTPSCRLPAPRPAQALASRQAPVLPRLPLTAGRVSRAPARRLPRLRPAAAIPDRDGQSAGAPSAMELEGLGSRLEALNQEAAKEQAWRERVLAAAARAAAGAAGLDVEGPRPAPAFAAVREVVELVYPLVDFERVYEWKQYKDLILNWSTFSDDHRRSWSSLDPAFAASRALDYCMLLPLASARDLLAWYPTGTLLQREPAVVVHQLMRVSSLLAMPIRKLLEDCEHDNLVDELLVPPESNNLLRAAADLEAGFRLHLPQAKQPRELAAAILRCDPMSFLLRYSPSRLQSNIQMVRALAATDRDIGALAAAGFDPAQVAKSTLPEMFADNFVDMRFVLE